MTATLHRAVRYEAETHRRFLAKPDSLDAYLDWSRARAALRRAFHADNSARVLADPAGTGLMLWCALFVALGSIAIVIAVGREWL